MSFSFAFDAPLGRLVRLPLRLIPKDMVLPVLSGELRGAKWVVGASINGCWLGSYERKLQRVFAEHIKPGDTVYDIGAHAGFFTLLAGRLTTASGRVFSFEPFPENISRIKRHIALNGVEHIRVLPLAVSDRNGEARFENAVHSSMGKLSENNSGATTSSLVVKTITIDSLVASGEITAPEFIKMDIEGAEVAALRGMLKTLNTSRPTIFIETHGADVHLASCKILEQAGYILRPLDAETVKESRELLALPQAAPKN